MTRDRKLKRLVFRLAVSCLGCFLVAGSAAAAQTEPFLRVRKNGVIYYYFNQRQDGYSRQFLYPNGPRQPGAAGWASDGQKRTKGSLDPLIKEVSAQYNLPVSLIKALIRVESNFNPAAVSPKGAQGLMQLMPETASDLGVADPFDIRENVYGGVRYLWMMLNKFNNRLHLALAAYNAGPKRVEKSQKVPDIRETQVFVKDVCEHFLKFENEP